MNTQAKTIESQMIKKIASLETTQLFEIIKKLFTMKTHESATAWRFVYDELEKRIGLSMIQSFVDSIYKRHDILKTKKGD